MGNKSRAAQFSMVLLIFCTIQLSKSQVEETPRPSATDRNTEADDVEVENNSDYDDQENSIIPTSLQTLLNKEVQNFVAPLHMRQGFPYYLSGFDDENRPIWVIEFGKYDVRGILGGGGRNLTDFDMYAHQLLFRMLNSTGLRSTAENPVTEFIAIVDLDGYNLSQLSSVPAVSFILRKLSQWFVGLERVHTAYGLNANFIAESLINLTKPVLGSLFNKIQVYGTNRQKWVPKLLKALPKDQIAEWYGGSKDFVPLQVFG